MDNARQIWGSEKGLGLTWKDAQLSPGFLVIDSVRAPWLPMGYQCTCFCHRIGCAVAVSLTPSLPCCLFVSPPLRPPLFVRPTSLERTGSVLQPSSINSLFPLLALCFLRVVLPAFCCLQSGTGLVGSAMSRLTQDAGISSSVTAREFAAPAGLRSDDRRLDAV